MFVSLLVGLLLGYVVVGSELGLLGKMILLGYVNCDDEELKKKLENVMGRVGGGSMEDKLGMVSINVRVVSSGGGDEEEDVDGKIWKKKMNIRSGGVSKCLVRLVDVDDKGRRVVVSEGYMVSEIRNSLYRRLYNLGIRKIEDNNCFDIENVGKRNKNIWEKMKKNSMINGLEIWFELKI